MRLTLIVALFLFAAESLAQPVDSLWQRSYGGGLHGAVSAMLTADDGGCIFAGETYSDSTRVNLWIVRTGSEGDTLWTRLYGGLYNDRCNTIKPVAQDGWILGGFTQSFGYSYFGGDIWLLRINDNGDTLWTRRYGDIGYDECVGICGLADGGFMVLAAGDTVALRFLRLDAYGDSLGSEAISTPDNIVGAHLLQTSDGGFMVTGSTAGGGALADAWLMKVDTFGQTEWSRAYGTTGLRSQTCSGIAEVFDGFVFTGQTVNVSGQPADLWLVKVNAVGDTVWTRSFGGSDGEAGVAVVAAPGGGFAIGATVEAFWEMYGDMWILRTDEDGDSLWSSTFGSSVYERCVSMCIASDGGYVLAGTYSTFSATDSSWLFKTSPDPLDVRIPPAVPHQLAFGIFPNPFNASASVQFELPAPARASLTVFDITGRLVQTIADRSYPAGEHHVALDASALTSGIYFLQLNGGPAPQTQKFVVLK